MLHVVINWNGKITSQLKMQGTQVSIEELSSEGTDGSFDSETKHMRQTTQRASITQEETHQTSMEVGETTSQTKIKVIHHN